MGDKTEVNSVLMQANGNGADFMKYSIDYQQIELQSCSTTQNIQLGKSCTQRETPFWSNCVLDN